MVAATAGHIAAARDADLSRAPSALGILAPAADVAVLPAKVADEIRVSPHLSTSRVLVPIAVLALLIALAALMRRRAAVAPSPQAVPQIGEEALNMSDQIREQELPGIDPRYSVRHRRPNPRSRTVRGGEHRPDRRGSEEFS